jgi:hypothetical protein
MNKFSVKLTKVSFFNSRNTSLNTMNTRVWRTMEKSASNRGELCGLRTNLKLNTLKIL